jgi:hypothetical protein
MQQKFLIHQRKQSIDIQLKAFNSISHAEEYNIFLYIFLLCYNTYYILIILAHILHITYFIIKGPHNNIHKLQLGICQVYT